MTEDRPGYADAVEAVAPVYELRYVAAAAVDAAYEPIERAVRADERERIVASLRRMDENYECEGFVTMAAAAIEAAALPRKEA